MAIKIKTEADRVPEAIKFVKEKIEELDRHIKECDYYEDVNGKLVYCPGSYAEEKRGYESEKCNWEVMLKILTYSAPCSIIDW